MQVRAYFWAPRLTTVEDTWRMRPSVRHWSTVAGAENAVTSREAAIEILALNVFGIADAAGRQVTRQLVESRLTELAGHPQGCGCGLCDLVGLVTVSKVHGGRRELVPPDRGDQGAGPWQPGPA